MIDLDIEMTEKLCRYEIERAERSGESVNPYCLHHAPAHAMLELITRLRQAEKDAERYQSANERAESLISYIDCEVSELVKNDYSRYCELDGIATETGYYLRAMKCEQ